MFIASENIQEAEMIAKKIPHCALEHDRLSKLLKKSIFNRKWGSPFHTIPFSVHSFAFPFP